MVAWVPLVMAGMQLMSTFGQAKAAKQQEKAYEQYQENTKQAAWENYRYQTRAINNRLSEEAEASALEQQQIQIQNMQARATAQASAAGSGITGSTIDNLFKDYDRASAASNYVAARNLYFKGLQAQDQKDAAYIQAINAINTMQPYTGQTASSILLQGLGKTFSTYANAYQTDYKMNNWFGGDKVTN